MDQLTDIVDNLKVELILNEGKFHTNDERYDQLNDAIDRISDILMIQNLYYRHEGFVYHEEYISD